MKTVSEKNEVIAKWMGIQVYKTYNEVRAMPLEKLSVWHLVDDLKYHEDWRYLMEVVEKIERTELPSPTLEGETTKVLFQSHGLIAKVWYPFGNNTPIIYNAGHTKIEAVHEAVYSFIEWYNKQVK